MSHFSHMAGIKHPDNMNRKEKLAMIKSFEDEKDALRFYLAHCGATISLNAFKKARGTWMA